MKIFSKKLRIVAYSLITSSLLIFLPNSANNYHSAVILLEKGLGEYRYNPDSGFLTQKLKNGLEQKKSVIISSGVILDNLIYSAQNRLKDKYDWSYFYLKAYNAIKQKEWLIFKHEQADIYILIPKKLKDADMGLKITNNPAIKEITSQQELEKALEQEWSIKPKETKEQLEQRLLAKDIDLKYLTDLFIINETPWLFYWAGHGWYTTKEYQGKKALDPKALIGGLNLAQMEEFINFLGDQLTTHCLCYETCFGGGYNAELVLNTLKKVKKPFIAICGSACDALKFGVGQNIYASYFKNAAYYYKDLVKLPESASAIKNFMKELQAILEPALGPMQYGDNREGKEKIVDRCNLASRLPLLYIPGWKNWQPVPIEHSLLTITNNSGKLEGQDLHALILQTETVSTPIELKRVNLKYAPTVITAAPSQDTYKINHLKAENISFTQLLDACLQINTASGKKFIIDNLACTNFSGSCFKEKQLSLKEVIIKKEPVIDQKTGVINKTVGQALFKEAKTDNWYYLQQENNSSQIKFQSLQLAEADKIKNNLLLA